MLLLRYDTMRDTVTLEHVTDNYVNIFSRTYFDLNYSHILKKLSNIIISTCSYRFLLHLTSQTAKTEPFSTVKDLLHILSEYNEYYCVIYNIGYNLGKQEKIVSFFVLDETVKNPKIVSLIRKQLLSELHHHYDLP